MDTNTQQVNEFSQGMVSDISDALLKDGQYRFAQNLRYVTNTDSNTGELHMIEGSLLSYTIHDSILATTQIRNYGIVITGTRDNWSIYRFENPYEAGEKEFKPIAELTKVFGPCTKPLGEGKLSLVTRWEDKDTVKLYLADGKNPLMVFNIMKDNGSDINAVTSYPSVTFKKPVFCGLINGTLKAGLVEYSYQFYTKYGHQSEISPSTKLIPLHTGSIAVESNKYVDGYEMNTTTDKGVRIKINKPTDVDSAGFTHIRVYRITYVENGQLPTIEVFYDEPLSWVDDSIYIEDTGRAAISVYSLEEYNSMTGIHIIPKVIESKNDYLFASNIREQDDYIDIDWQSTEDNFSYRYVITELVGELNDSADCINVQDLSEVNIAEVPVLYYDSDLQEDGSDTIDISEYIEGDIKNDTYANPKVSYMFKSLRRDETYRYGIIFYTADGGYTKVKHLVDIHTPTVYTPGFETFRKDENDKLIVRSLGVQFKITPPEGVISYEIVRCGRTISDTKNLSQGVISRPVKRIGDPKTPYPYTPTGFLTTDDVYQGMYIQDNEDEYNRYGYSATNYTIPGGGFGNDAAKYRGENNTDIYQFVSPEVCYLSDTFATMIDKRDLMLSTKTYLYPNQTTIQKTFDLGNTVEGAWDVYVPASEGDSIYINPNKEDKIVETVGENLSENWLMPGNVYTNIPLAKDNTIFIQNNLTTVAFYSDINKERLSHGNKTFAQNFRDVSTRYSYMKLYDAANTEHVSQDLQSIKINQLKPTDTLNWNDFISTSNSDGTVSYYMTYEDKQTSIGGVGYTNFVIGGMYGTPYKNSVDNIEWGKQEEASSDSYNYLDDGDSIMGSVVGPGGKCFIMQIKDDYPTEEDNFNRPIYRLNKGVDNALFGTYLCNIQQNVIPYGGNDDVAKETSSYNSYGDYFDASETEVNIFDGDTFIQPFEYVSQHKCYSPQQVNLRTACIVYSIPVETSINLTYTYGYEFSKNKNNSSGDITNIQVEAGNVFNKFTQDRDLYLYNAAYSANNSVQVHGAELTTDEEEELDTDYRTFFSNKKENNEPIDSWVKFMPANFLDVDTRYGAITGLRRFHNRLVFWQEEATGLFSVEERTTITDESNMPLILGTGGVLSRYDYLATSNGMHKDQFSDAQSDSTLYWWDYNKHELCAYSGEGVLILSKVKLIQNALNESYEKHELNEHPMLTFDKRFNELIASVDKERSIVYSEVQAAFSGVYDIKPEHAISFADRLYFAKTENNAGKLYEWNQRDGNGVYGLNLALTPAIMWVVNSNPTYNKVFDNQEFAGRVYGGGDQRTYVNNNPLNNITIDFKTPLKQHASLLGDKIDNTEYNFRYAVPRHEDALYGDRLRGKTMQCKLQSSSNDYDFSLQWIKTKYRISWS